MESYAIVANLGRLRFEAWLAALPLEALSLLFCKMGLWQSPLYRVSLGNWCVENLVQGLAYRKCFMPTSHWTLLLSTLVMTEGQGANQSPATHTG